MGITIGFVGERDLCDQLEALAPPGCTFECLTTAEAVVAVRDGTLTLLMVALDTPDWRDSLEPLAELHRANEERPVPVLALVPRHDTAALVTAFDSGVSECVALPLDTNEFRARLGALLRRRHTAAVKQAETRAIWRLAQTDPVTGLYSRTYLDGVLPTAIDVARAADRPLALLMIDLDALKPFNDRWGHAAGDRALRAVATALQGQVRSSDMVARYGGDEIVVVMPDTDLETARRVAGRLNAIVAETPVGGDTGGAGLTVSIGVATLTESVRDARHLIDRADAALYAAKRAGRNQVAEAA